jgi:hypothetical protein
MAPLGIIGYFQECFLFPCTSLWEQFFSSESKSNNSLEKGVGPVMLFVLCGYTQKRQIAFLTGRKKLERDFIHIGDFSSQLDQMMIFGLNKLEELSKLSHLRSWLSQIFTFRLSREVSELYKR